MKKVDFGDEREERCLFCWEHLEVMAMVRIKHRSKIYQAHRLSLLLNGLNLPTMQKIYSKDADDMGSNGCDFRAYLQALLEEELEERRTWRIARHIRDAHFRLGRLLAE